MKVLGIALGVAFLLLLFSACNGDATPTTAPAIPTPTATAVATATPAPIATPTTEPAPTATPPAPAPTATVPAVVSPTATPSPVLTLATSTPSPTTTPTPQPTPTVRQELRVNLGGEPTSLDPQIASFATDFSVILQVFRGLLGFKPDLSLEPVVVTQVPTVGNGGISEDGLTYTFTLREDVTWGDGKQVTAEDFEYSIKRLLDPEVAAPGSFLYTVIKGAGEYNGSGEADPATRQALRDAVGVDAPDRHTLRINLAGPNPTFLQKMALTFVYPVRRDVVEQLGDQWTEAGNYMGNGPYRMTEWVHQDHITLEADPEYWGPKPKLATINYKMIADPNSELAAYRNDELELGRVPPGTERAILDDPELGKEVIRSKKLTTIGLFFNTSVPPFDDVKVRQAFATAIDREAWIDKVKNGLGQPATSWLPPAMPGFDPELGKDYVFNPDRARQLLADAGFPGGEGFPSVSFPFVNLLDQPLIAQFIQAQMKENLGVDVALEPLDPPSYGQRVIGARQFEMTSVGWSADYPDPESFLALLFSTGAPFNIMAYSNPEFDRLAGLASTELDQRERIDLWKRAHEIMVNEAPIAFFFYEEDFFLKKPAVQGLTLTGIDGAIPGDTRLAEVFLAP